MKITLDKSLLLSILFFLGFGLVQVYSSSFIFAIESYGDGHYFVKKQLLFTAAALLILFITLYFPFRWIERYGYLLWAATVVALALTLVPGIGVKVGGAFRWLQLPLGFRFEPGEVFKVTLPILMATFIARDQAFLKSFAWPWRLICVFGPCFILLKQPDFGTFVISMLIVLTLTFAFGLKWRYIFAAAVVSLPLFYFLVIQVPYRYARVAAFLDPWSGPAAKGFQVIQSMLSFHAGGLWGAGLGQGQGKLFFLPEAHTDFTLAVLGEELGFLGFAFVLLLYAFIIFRGFQIAFKAHNIFAQALALGITSLLGISVFINVGVAIGLLPTKGLTLPFLSYGGSSLIATCFAMGLLLNIDRASRTQAKPFRGLKI